VRDPGGEKEKPVLEGSDRFVEDVHRRPVFWEPIKQVQGKGGRKWILSASRRVNL